ncbi:hypothetical protein D6C84_08176 [Aureobasidium pullulans]|uniref:Uncharacterized protein n=1 Tax=Aureobasidium pullulans TaxID=5580 RepID=A0A4S9XGC5_AURPU|nr:hypothetical protein D6C84_08176 [Aureobasidium pullulans]
MFIPTISTVLSALSTLSGLAAIPTQHPSSSSDVALNPHDVVVSSQTRVGRVTESCYQPILGLRQCTMYTVYGDSFRGEAAAKTTMSSKPTETPGNDTEDEVVTVTVDAPEKIVTVTTTEEPDTVWEDVITTVHVTSTVDLPEVTVTETAKASTTIDEPEGTAEPIRHHPKTSATPSTKRAKPSSSASSPASKKTSSFSDRRSKKPKTTSASAVASTAVASSASTSASSSNPLQDLFDSVNSYDPCPLLMPGMVCEDFKLKKIRASSASVSASPTASATSDFSLPYSDFSIAWTAPPSPAPTTMDPDGFTTVWTAPPSPAPTTMGTVVKVNIVVEATQSATTQSLDWEDKVDDSFENRDWFVPKNFTLHGSRTV